MPFYTKKGKLMAILEVDSEKINDFDQTEAQVLEQIADLLRDIWE